MSTNPEIDPAIGTWFKKYRESYEWPLGTGRSRSEQVISNLQSSACSSILERDVQKLASSLIAIHRWKTQNRQDQTSKYCKTLESLGEPYLKKIIDLGPFTFTNNLELLIYKLKVRNCNLPVCTAAASFLFNRQSVPILDKFLSQFFTRQFKVNLVDKETLAVLQFVKKVPFRLEDGGTGSLRLSVYNQHGFDYNMSKYINDFVPECNRIAQSLRQSGISYNDTQGKLVEFNPIDIDMAVFSFASKHSNYF
jgi:hypothetical protein